MKIVTRLSNGMVLGADGAEYLEVPFLFVPDGQEPCPRWLAEHPEWIKLPAVFVPDGARGVDRQSPGRAEPAGRDGVMLASAEGGQDPAPPVPSLIRVNAVKSNRLVIFIGGFFDYTNNIVKGYFDKFYDDTRFDRVYAGHDDGAEVEKLIENTPENVSITVVGHSWGADTAAKIVASSRRKIDLLVTIDPVSGSPPNFDTVAKHATRWINVSAVPTNGGDRSDYIARRGGQWGESVAGKATEFIRAPASHGGFEYMLTMRTASGRTIGETIGGGENK